MRRATIPIPGTFPSVLAATLLWLGLAGGCSMARAEAIASGSQAASALVSGYIEVKAGDTARSICRSLARDRPLSIRQCVSKLYLANPRAFLNSSPDRLRAGAVLTIPNGLLVSATPAIQNGSPPSAEAPANAQPSGQNNAAVLPARVVGSASDLPTAIEAPTAPQVVQAKVGVVKSDREVASPPSQLSAGPAPYRDKLIGGVSTPDDAFEGKSTSASDQLPGQRSISIELSNDFREEPGAGRARQHAIALQYRRETENYGEWFLDLGAQPAVQSSFPRTFDAKRGGRATLFHNLFPVTEGWIANSIIGAIRNPLNPLTTNSFRQSLSSPTYSGFATNVGDGSKEIRFAAGSLGTFSGLGGNSFTTTGGRFISLGGNARLAADLSLGAQTITTIDVPNVIDHTSLVAALRYILPEKQGDASMRVLLDGKGRQGGWADVDIARDQLRHLFGVFRLDPGLLWADSTIANDQQGAYWRGESRRLRQFISGGVSITDTNLTRDESRGGQTTGDAFIGTTLRIDRNLSLGGNFSTVVTQPKRPTAARSKTFSGSAFLSRSSWFGVTRLDVARYLIRPENSSQDSVATYSVSHDWANLGAYALATAATASHETSSGRLTRRESANLSLRSPMSGNTQWDLSAAIARTAGDRGVEKNINFAASGTWSITPDLSASLQLVWNTIDASPSLPGAVTTPFRREKRAQLTFRYEDTSGSPYASASMLSGRQFGTGRITGVVFFDENGDGIRQANEKGAPSIVVFLDGRLPASTDSNGRYTFAAVPTGAHTVLVQNDGVPLPWTFDRESGLSVTAPLRGEAVQDIPLVRINR